jgi:hypothetical protein
MAGFGGTMPPLPPSQENRLSHSGAGEQRVSPMSGFATSGAVRHVTDVHLLMPSQLVRSPPYSPLFSLALSFRKNEIFAERERQ